MTPNANTPCSSAGNTRDTSSAPDAPDAESSATQEDLVTLNYLITKRKSAEGWSEADYAKARKIGLIVDPAPASAADGR